MKENVSLLLLSLLLILPSFMITLNCRETERANGFEEKGLLLDPHSQPKPEAPEHPSVTDTHYLTSVILVAPACALKDLQRQSLAPLLLPFTLRSICREYIFMRHGKYASLHYCDAKDKQKPYTASEFFPAKFNCFWFLAVYLTSTCSHSLPS